MFLSNLVLLSPASPSQQQWLQRREKLDFALRLFMAHYEFEIPNFLNLLFKYNVKGPYTDDRCRSHNFQLISYLSDRRYIEQLVRAQYPAEKVFIIIVNQGL